MLLDEQTWASYAIIGTPASCQNPKPFYASITGAAKSLAGHREAQAPQEGHTLTRHSFDDSRKLLPKAAPPQMLLDDQSPSGELEDTPSHISGAPLLAPWPTTDFKVRCD